MPKRTHAMPSERFSLYTAEELECVGRAFVEDVTEVQKRLDKIKGTATWTHFVLDWFAAAAGPGRVVDARRRGPKAPVLPRVAPRRTYGEFMLDMTHSTFPGYDEGKLYSEEYWQKALQRAPSLDLALESEFGKKRNAKLSRFMVLEDAAKLAVVRASVKVLVFGTGTGQETAGIVNDVTTLRTGAEDPAPWLWIDLPWDLGPDGWVPQADVIVD